MISPLSFPLSPRQILIQELVFLFQSSLISSQTFQSRLIALQLSNEEIQQVEEVCKAGSSSRF